MAIRGWYKVYRSLFNGDACVCVITRSRNRKTGARTKQVWYLPAGVPPIDAKRCGADKAVCGDCPMHEACYVAMRAPQAVWKAWRRGAYVDLDQWDGPAPPSWIGENMRFGAWGDPLSAPKTVYRRVLYLFRPVRHQVFTHAWRLSRAATWVATAMASVEDPVSAHVARARGWRTFRVRTGGLLMPGESRCASEAAGIKCEDCGRCGPNGGPRCPVILAHGALKRRAETIVVNLL